MKIHPNTVELSRKNALDFDFEALRYAALAISKDPRREILSSICVHKGAAIGTDGRRLHWAKLSGMIFPNDDEKVLYQVAKLTLTKILLLKVDCSETNSGLRTYPNYEQVIPKDLEKSLGSYDLSNAGASESSIFCDILNAAEKTAFNFDFFKPLIPGGYFEAFQKDDRSPLCLIQKDPEGLTIYKGILMPIRVA